MRTMILASALLLGIGADGTGFVLSHVELLGSPRRLDAGDVDGDGDVDLLVLSGAPGQTFRVEVLVNGGEGAFTPGWSEVDSMGSFGLPWDLDLADTDGDGDLDLLFVVPSGAPKERFNDGAGNFGGSGHIPAFALRAAQEPADVDDNGAVDLVYYEEDIIGYFGTLHGQGDGSFQFDLSTETFGGLDGWDLTRRFVLGDVTGDGLRDAAMASKSGLRLIPGRPPLGGSPLPGWQSAELLTSEPCRDVVMADLDGDGRLDVAASAPLSDAVLVLLALPSGSLGSPSAFPAGNSPEALAAADLDLDGDVDIIVANPRAASVNVLYGDGAGGLGAAQAHTVGRQPRALVADDLDGDGDPDLAVGCARGNTVALLFNQAR